MSALKVNNERRAAIYRTMIFDWYELHGGLDNYAEAEQQPGE